MKQKTTAVYRIINKINGKLYYGSSCHIEERFYRHKLLLNKGKHENPYLQNAWNKYGDKAFVFEIAELCDKTILAIREQFYMDSSRSTEREYGYNICPQANHSVMSEETKKKIGDANRGKSTWIKGKHHTPQARYKMSVASKLNNEMKGKIGPLHPFYGKTHSKESRQKMSLAKKGRFNNKSSKPVYQLLDNVIISTFPSLQEAGRATGIEPKNISACLNNRRKKAGGYEWKCSDQP